MMNQTPFGQALPLSLLLILFILLPLPVAAQPDRDSVDALQRAAPRVYIDCSLCDLDYFRTELTYVNHVRDRTQAHVHVLITSMFTGGGGKEYTLTFIGQHRFAGVNDTLTHVANKTDTQDMIRQGLVRMLRKGLFRYVLHTPLADYFTVSYNRPTAAEGITDAWDYWVFSISANSFLNGESQYSSGQVWGGVTASRVTEAWKLRFSFNGSYNESRYDVQVDENTVITSRSISRSQWFNGFVVARLSDHWSAGIFTYLNSSTYNNLAFSLTAQPGLEFNVFPYNESTHHQLRFGYQIGITANSYLDTTIYFQKSEALATHTLSASLVMQQPWGSTSVTLSGSQYLHDLSKNSLSISGNISLRLFEGLSFTVAGGYSAVHNQISLPKSTLTPEEVYQQRRELAKSYSYWGSFGLSYSFGSIFNNIVNARFGNQGGGGTTIIMSD